MKGTLAQNTVSSLFPRRIGRDFGDGSSVWDGSVGWVPCLMHTCMLEHGAVGRSLCTQVGMDVHVCRLSVGGCSWMQLSMGTSPLLCP